MFDVRALMMGALLASAGCVPVPEEAEIGEDPQDPPEVTVAEHPAPDGELTRLEPRVEALPDDVLADRLAQARVAFVGEVVAISHRDVTLPELGATPHTFVTVRVVDPVKGGVAGEQVTLRFIGGPADDGQATLEVSGIPEFEVGEVDLLFVSDDNGRSGCPLVGCESGRLPVVGDQITSPTGHLLVTLDDGRTRFAEAVSAPEPTQDEGLDVDPPSAPIGTPLDTSDVVRRLARSGPAAATLSVSPLHPSR